MNKKIGLSLLLVSFLCSQCAVYSPDCGRSIRVESAETEDNLVYQAREAWNILKDKRQQDCWPKAMQQYNRAVYALVERVASLSSDEVVLLREDKYAFVFRRESDKGENNVLYDKVVPADKVDVSTLEEVAYLPGLGIPLAGQENSDVMPFKPDQVNDASGVHTLTAVLDFHHTIQGKPVLKYVHRLCHDSFKIENNTFTLAANYSAPIAYLWKQSKVDDYKLLGLFRPAEAINTKGLFFSEPYNKNKIPVVFVHGLQSSPETFSNLTNRLMSSPQIRNKYQFWFYGYPTGGSWTVSAEGFRKSIRAARQQYDPLRKDKNFDQMVIVAHSMGGLVTRYNLSENPWEILKYELKPEDRQKLSKDFVVENVQQFDQFVGRSGSHDEDIFVFDPVKSAKCVVFLATPHRGSEVADWWITTLLSKLIDLPENILKEGYKIATFDHDNLLVDPGKLVKGMTSVNQLRPQNEFILGLNDMSWRSDVAKHSVIGDRGKGNSPNSSDGFVPYWSSHLDQAKTEKIVPSGHSVQDNPQTATEVASILLDHLRGLNMANDTYKCKTDVIMLPVGKDHVDEADDNSFIPQRDLP